MNCKWQNYEEEVYEECCRIYGEENVERNVSKVGVSSMVPRQIGVLVHSEEGDIAYDAKYYSKHVDVKPDDNQIHDYNLERVDEQYEIWMSIKKFVDNPEMRKFGQKLGDDINTYSLFTIGWMPRITIQEQQMLAVAIKVSYEFVNEGKTDDIDKVKSMRAIKMKYKKQQDVVIMNNNLYTINPHLLFSIHYSLSQYERFHHDTESF